MNPKLLSIQIGRPQTYTDDQGTWETAFFKQAVAGPIFLGPSGLEGDAVSDTKHHGGLEQAVLMYSADHYPDWQAELGMDLPFGAFAENLTVRGLDEHTVFIGDVYQVGRIRLKVTKPRIPCWKIARRWNMPDLTKRTTQTSRTGWYCQVLQDGKIESGLTVDLLERSEAGQTIRQVFENYLQSG